MDLSPPPVAPPAPPMSELMISKATSVTGKFTYLFSLVLLFYLFVLFNWPIFLELLWVRSDPQEKNWGLLQPDDLPVEYHPTHSVKAWNQLGINEIFVKDSGSKMTTVNSYSKTCNKRPSIYLNMYNACDVEKTKREEWL